MSNPGSLYTPPGGTSGPPSSSFPKVVAKVNLTAQAGSQTITLLSHPNGDYVLNDLIYINPQDSTVRVVYSVSWEDDGLSLTVSADLGISGGAIQALSPLSVMSAGSGSQAGPGFAWPLILRANGDVP